MEEDDEPEYSLVLIDDFANDLKDKGIQKMLNSMLIKARHLNCGFIFTLQSIMYMPKILRRQITYATIFKPRNSEEWSVIREELLQKNEANKIIGQANIKAMTVLIDAVNQRQDTLPHEYAHRYIAWFRNTPIVQEGIKRFGSEEALVQAIGEQVVKQKGDAYNWWKKFTNFILNLLSDKQVLS